MGQECALDEGADAGAFVWYELVVCSNVKAQRCVLRAAVVRVEDELIGGDALPTELNRGGRVAHASGCSDHVARFFYSGSCR